MLLAAASEKLIGSNIRFILQNVMNGSDHVLRLGSACTGSSMDFACLDMLFRKLGMVIPIQYTLACENVGWKQDFITAGHDVQFVCSDVQCLAEDSAVTIHGAAVPIPSVDFFNLGFSCKNMSTLNVKRRQFRKALCKKSRAHLAAHCHELSGHVLSRLKRAVEFQFDL